MRRLLAIVLLAVGIPTVLALGLGAKTDGGSGYQVRAIFDNAAYAVPGEEVRVAGQKVGKIDSLDVAYERKAAVTFSIDTAGFSPFHKDAHCTIRPQSLIGEKYVECTPGSRGSPELEVIPDGQPGAGKHLLPLRSTSSPVDIDLIGDINRLPYRQRLAIIINEFGTALAGRGRDLNEAIHRANPALRETDKVLAILAKQNKVLADLAVNSDRVIGPLADKRRRIAHVINAANETGTATAERSADIEASFERFPGFLRQLRPTLQQLGEFADQTTPVLNDLHTAAPDLSRFVLALKPFSKSATISIVSLGKAAEIGRPAIVASLPVTKQVAKFAKNALPVGNNLAKLLTSFDKTGGIERLMDYIFFQVTAINGFDGVSHYLRAALIANLCSAYALTPAGGCNSNFTSGGSSKIQAKTGDPGLDRLHAALAAQLGDGSNAKGTGAKPTKKKKHDSADPFKTLRELTDPKAVHQRHTTIDNATGRGRQPGQGRYHRSPEDQALDYLLGGGG
jgi:phospholipid/cholesterol/gamma-HCH transport system substrate-binding protein